MTRSTPLALVCVGALAVSLAGCSTPLSDLVSGTACTAIGNAEAVDVDLADVLDLEGGDYFAQVSVPSVGASDITGFAGNDEYYPGGYVEADLTGEPTVVEVVVRDEGDRVVYTASDSATPTLYQPNGPTCDGENYDLSLLATPQGGLERLTLPPEGPRLDAAGRESVALHTACGIDRLELGQGTSQQATYARVGGTLTGPDGGAPPGWNAPHQRGWATREGDRALYTDDAGHRETFQRDDTLGVPPPCG